MGQQTFRNGLLTSLFPASSAEETQLSAGVARLCVLYEDIRIELKAMIAEELAVLDETDRNFRKVYFFRRSIGTLLEFAEAIRLLEQSPKFADVRSQFSARAKTDWSDALKFFSVQEHGLLQKVRHDIGGHFGHPAALHSVKNLQSHIAGGIWHIQETRRGEHVYQTRINFSSEIAAGGSLRHLPGSTTEEKMQSFLDEVLIPGSRLAILAVDAIIVHHLWPRLGRS